MPDQTPFLIQDETARRRALELVLDTGAGPAATAAAVRGIRQYTESCGVHCDVYSSRVGTAYTPVVLMVSPGRMCLVMFARPNSNSDSRDTIELLNALSATHCKIGTLFFQSLTEINDEPRKSILTAAGFRRITQLVYLERNARHPWIDPPEPNAAEWIAFSDSIAEKFAATIRATYRETLDCPELSGRRSDADILASHRTSGEFSADRWELAQVDGNIAGCILLNRVVATDAFEVAYMGVVPAFRGRGVGALLLRRALEKARTAGAKLLTLAVDARNLPARKLYEKLGFRAIAIREAYLRFLDDRSADFQESSCNTCG